MYMYFITSVYDVYSVCELYSMFTAFIWLLVPQFINYCLSESAIELVVFWLDVEHFKHFDGGNEDLRLFAHHISESFTTTV